MTSPVSTVRSFASGGLGARHGCRRAAISWWRRLRRAAPLFGIPVFGTMAHSFVQAHDSEQAAFAHFAQSFPDNAVLLVDTYDTLEGVRKATTVPGQAERGAPG